MRHDLLQRRQEKQEDHSSIEEEQDNIHKDEETNLLQEFYKQVYSSIDTTALQLQQLQASSFQDNTGYTHTTTTSYSRVTPTVLHYLQNSPHPIYIASNSPLFHVKKVLRSLGISDVSIFRGMLTPDSPLVQPSLEGKEEDEVCFPTKSQHPKQFYSTLLSKYPTETHDIVLIDDSISSLKGAQNVGIRGIRISSTEEEEEEEKNDNLQVCTSLEDAITSFISPQEDNDKGYTFSQVKYLKSKNVVDAQSINAHVWNTLASELASSLLKDGKNEGGKNGALLRIADVGAGVLSMLKFMMHGGGNNVYGCENDEEQMEKNLESLFDILLRKLEIPNDNHAHTKNNSESSSKGTLKQIQYDAYESNVHLMGACRQVLQELGFVQIGVGGIGRSKEQEGEGSKKDGPIAIFRRKPTSSSPSLSSSMTQNLKRRPSDDLDIIVRLFLQDFTTTSSSTIDTFTIVNGEEGTIENNSSFSSSSPHLIVGCCLADLFHPTDLTRSIFKFANFIGKNDNTNKQERKNDDVLLYFPITFAGTTSFYPPKPFGISSTKSNNNGKNSMMMVPSDTVAFHFYSHLLSTKYRHNLNPSIIVSTMKKFNWKTIASGASHWSINPIKHAYLWNTMIYFFKSTGLLLELMNYGWDGIGWFERIFERDVLPDICASNVDLLFRYAISSEKSSYSTSSSPEKQTKQDEIHENNAMRNKQDEAITTVGEIQFVSPRNVTKITKLWKIMEYENNQDLNVKNKEEVVYLGPNQVEVQSICSLISSGTELKIFRGTFDNDSDAALDINIKGMDDSTMSYPLTYGYSLVGRVVKCGSAVPDADSLHGRLVFTFSPHSSRIIADRESLHVVPEGISAEDAIFFPSVETALSLVHDAHVRIGERVAIFGQGLIGLLVTSILSLQEIASSRGGRAGGSSISSVGIAPTTDGRFGAISVFDTIGDRLAAASEMGASEALLPSESHTAGPFDVAIEVSGNARALQSAIDSTSPGGRIIVGSWYGNDDVRLKLGIDFHRSRKTIKASQVSEIPPELRGLWTKERRFALAWELMKLIRPSRLITKTVTLDQAQEAYELLDRGDEISVSFRY